MHIEKKYSELENIEEVRIYNLNMNELYHEAPQVKKSDKIRFNNVMKHVPSDINVFLPIDDGEDYIIERIGWNLLQRINVNMESVQGRKLSQVSPFFYDLLKDNFKEVLQTGQTKSMRLFYYISDKIRTLANLNIILEV